MGIFLAVLAVAVFVLLVVLAAMQPARPQYELSELKRRSKKSDAFLLELDRYELHTAVVTLLRSVRAFLIVILTCLLIGVFGWGMGIVLALVFALAYPLFARMKSVRSGSQSLYGTWEARVLDFAARFEKILHIFREPSEPVHAAPSVLRSREQLSELIAQSQDVLSPHEKTLLVSALAFGEKPVETVMTPRAMIDFIKNSEFLGPLVLDELHGLGHSRLPVIAEDLDNVVGILHLRDMLSLSDRNSTTAEKAMEKKVYYIRADDTLEHALSAFIKTRHHLFIVINNNRETVGLVTLEDVIEALIGRKIVDEDDIHADLRAVAARESKHNNASEGHVDV